MYKICFQIAGKYKQAEYICKNRICKYFERKEIQYRINSKPVTNSQCYANQASLEPGLQTETVFPSF